MQRPREEPRRESVVEYIGRGGHRPLKAVFCRINTPIMARLFRAIFPHQIFKQRNGGFAPQAYLLRYGFRAISWLHGSADDRTQGPHQHEAADEVAGDTVSRRHHPLEALHQVSAVSIGPQRDPPQHGFSSDR